MPSYAELKDRYERLISDAEVRERYVPKIERAARRILANRERYKRVEKRTGVPWDFIGALHWRESNCNFKGALHNGDPIIGTGRKTYRVPAGRGPFATWEESATDALALKDMDKWDDWSLEGRAYKAEEYNGFGYYFRKIASPYVFSGTSVYTRGAFYRDSKFSRTIVDKRPGVIPIMLRIQELTERKVVVENSRKVSLLRRVSLAIRSLFAALATVFSLDKLQVFTGWLDPLSGLLDGKTLGVIVVVGLAVLILGRWLTEMIQKDFADGRYTPSGAAETKAEEPESTNL